MTQVTYFQTYSFILNEKFLLRYGMKVVIGVGNLISTAMTLISPVAARTSFELFVVVRIIQGLAQVSISYMFKLYFLFSTLFTAFI